MNARKTHVRGRRVFVAMAPEGDTGELFEVFRSGIEEVNGYAYLVKDEVELSGLIAEIARRSNSRMTVKQHLKLKEEQRITTELELQRSTTSIMKKGRKLATYSKDITSTVNPS